MPAGNSEPNSEHAEVAPGGFLPEESSCIHTLHCSQDSTPPKYQFPDTFSGIWFQSSSMIQHYDVHNRDFLTSTNS